MNKFKKAIIFMLLSTFPLSVLGCNSNKEKGKESVDITISAAASLKESMGEIQKNFEKEYPNIHLTFNFASSGSLQKQIEQGAPCDIFISASDTQMNILDDKNLILENTKKELVKNSLVLIIPSDSSLQNISDLTSSNVLHIAMGEPSSVPAGKYASETLEYYDLTNKINSKLVYAKDVKEVLSWVASKNAEAGFVYKSDSMVNDSIKVLENIDPSSHSAINYPVGIIKDSKNVESAKIFEDYLYNDTCKNIFEKYGYTTL